MFSQFGNIIQSLSNRSLARNESKLSTILECQRSVKMKNSKSESTIRKKFQTIPIDDVTNLACYSDSEVSGYIDYSIQMITHSKIPEIIPQFPEIENMEFLKSNYHNASKSIDLLEIPVQQ